MKQQVQAAIDSVKGKYTEKRTGLFQVEGRHENGTVALSGRVLEKAAITDLRRAIVARVPNVRIDDSAVRVLRREPAVRRIVATNLTDLHAEPSFISELLTQVLNGQPLEILDESDRWCYVRQEDGYLGWMYADYLRQMDAVPEPTHVVIAPAVRLYVKPTAKAAVATCLLCGTAVSVAKTKSTWAYVKPAGGMLAGGWMLAKELRALKSLISPSPVRPNSRKSRVRGKGKAVNAAKQIITDARRLTGVYYLWGGATPFGLDCSALVQLTHRLSGYTIPRDAYMQYTKGKPVEPPYQPGDLLYFHSDSDKQRITHVGISLGGWDMIHSSRANNGVYEENVETAARLRDTFAGARTVVR